VVQDYPADPCRTDHVPVYAEDLDTFGSAETKLSIWLVTRGQRWFLGIWICAREGCQGCHGRKEDLDAQEQKGVAEYYENLMSGLKYLWLATRAGFAAQHVKASMVAPADFLVGANILPYFENHPDNPYHCRVNLTMRPCGVGAIPLLPFSHSQ
jgi:hypothetical protein